MFDFDKLLIEGIDAPTLNDKWDDLGSKFDSYYYGLSKDLKDFVGKSISNWQDWYYSDKNYNKWGDTSYWDTLYITVSNELDKFVKDNKLIAKKVTDSKPSAPIDLPPLTVYGKVPHDYLWLILGGTGLFLTYLLNTKKKRKNVRK